jgi:hypothetical protein
MRPHCRSLIDSGRRPSVQYVRTTIDLLTRDIAEVVADLNWLPMPATA